jgi:hypothetical protein
MKSSDEKVLKTFLQFSDALRKSLETRSEVIGLVLVGSTAATNRVDEWSDHDFFVITKAGSAESMRQDLSWLPRHSEIAFSPRETEHGLKVIYQGGQVLEFAVFDDPELEVVSVNSYAVVLDRTNIKTRMDAIAARRKTHAFNAEAEFELFLGQILIGVGRARRGELLSAGQFVDTFAMNHALGLIRSWSSSIDASQTVEDDLNRFRRFEFQYAEIGTALQSLRLMDVESSAKELLKIVRDVGKSSLSESQLRQMKVVIDRLGWQL